MKDTGFPHSEIHGSGPVDGSPWLIAVCRVLHRLVMPRHPSCARIRLARNFSLSRYVAILFKSKLPVFKDRSAAVGLPRGVANEDIVYQKSRRRARGFGKIFEKSFGWDFGRALAGVHNA